jgi:hypothetical protein
MGNGALPSGPSYRAAHPRLYRTDMERPKREQI